VPFYWQPSRPDWIPQLSQCDLEVEGSFSGIHRLTELKCRNVIQPLGVNRRCNTFASSGKTARWSRWRQSGQVRAAWWMCPATLLNWTDAWDFRVLLRPTPSPPHCVMLNRVIWYIGISISEDPTASIFRTEEWSDCPTLKTHVDIQLSDCTVVTADCNVRCTVPPVQSDSNIKRWAVCGCRYCRVVCSGLGP